MAVTALRVVLAAVFCVSALAKLRQRRQLRATTEALGVPRVLAAPVARLLPLVELVVAAALVPATTAPTAAWLGASLLLAFTALLVANLGTGRRPACACFGALSSRPISWTNVLRNVALAVASVVVASSEGGRSLPDAFEGAEPSTVVLGGASSVLAVLVVVQGWALLRLLRQHGRMLLRLDALEAHAPAPVAREAPTAGLPVGTAAPEFSLQGLHGETMTLSALRSRGKPVLLVFSDPGCGPCAALAPTIADWQRRHAEVLRVVVVSAGSPETNRAKAAEHGLIDVYLQEATEVAEAYAFEGTPGAVLVDVAGRVAAPLATGAPAIDALVDRVVGTVPVKLGRRDDPHVHHHPQTVGLPVGADAPPFRLPTVGGGEASLEEFRGRPVVLLFWNPRCGFCESLLPDLLAWEASRGADAPELLVISTGDEAANAASGFTSTVLLDAASTAMTAYRATGTPMAVALDATGRVASATGVGAAEVLRLLDDQRKASA